MRTTHRYDAELRVDRRDHVGGLGHEPQLPLAFLVHDFDERQRCVRKIWGCFQVWLHIGCIDGGGVEIGHCSQFMWGSQTRSVGCVSRAALDGRLFCGSTGRAYVPEAVCGQLLCSNKI